MQLVNISAGFWSTQLPSQGAKLLSEQCKSSQVTWGQGLGADLFTQRLFPSREARI